MKKPKTPSRRRSASRRRVRPAAMKAAEPAQPWKPESMGGPAGIGSNFRSPTGQIIFAQGDAADAVYFIKSGRVQLNVVSDQGKEGVIALLGKGDFFGEGCLAGQSIRLASAVATAASSLTRIEKAEMARALHDEPPFSDVFTAFLVSRTIQVEADLVDQLFNSSEKRLARLLLLLANFNSNSGLHLITPKVSQEVLAARVGTTRSRINYFMNKFRRLGLIEYNGSIKVHTGLLNVIVHE